MIEIILKDYLEKALDVPVLLEVPQNPPESYILIDKTGSSGRVHNIQTATVAIQSYAPSMLLAAELNEKVKDAMEMLVILPTVSRSELNTDYNFADTQRKLYRYQAVFDIVHY